MSAETTTNASSSKKSFLTRLAENVAAKKNAVETDENVTHLPDEAAAKRSLMQVGAVAFVGLAALGTAAIVIVKKLGEDETTETEEDEETTSED